MKTLKETLKKYDELSAEGDKIMDQLLEDPTNEELEKYSDKLYEEEYEMLNKAIAMIVKISAGKIDEITAKIMIKNSQYRKTLDSILAMAA